jgi:ribosome-associated toxin RatA of RatAB toxin-antitoxin module
MGYWRLEEVLFKVHDERRRAAIDVKKMKLSHENTCRNICDQKNDCIEVL